MSAALLLVLFMMYRAKDPAVWAWMFPPAQNAGQAAAANEDKLAQPAAEANSRPLPAELYATVEDDTLLRGGDRKPLLATFAWLKKTPEAEIDAASSGRVAFAQLLQQPGHYRGQLVTVSGTLRQVSTRRRQVDQQLDNVEPAEGAENESTTTVEDAGQDIDTWYEFFLQPVDHPSEPIIIYGLTLPVGLPEAGRMRQPARVTGVFFKRLVYGAANEPALAPLLLAKEIELTGPAEVAAEEESTIELIVISGVIALLAAAIFMFAYRKITGQNRSAERSAEAILARLESRRGK